MKGQYIEIEGPAAKKLQGNLKRDIYNFNSVIISSVNVMRILASQKRFQTLSDEIFNIDKFVE